MDILRDLSRWAHVIFGFTGLVAFWFPVFSRKGGRLHNVAGKVFVFCGYWVTGSAAVSCLLVAVQALAAGAGLADLGTVIFLAYLALVTLTSLRHGVRVLATRRDPSALDTLWHRGLAWSCIVGCFLIIAYALIFRSSLTLLLLGFSIAGWGMGRSVLDYIRKPPPIARAWFYEHMNAMLGAGIAFHTAFAIFGTRRFFELEAGGWGLVRWFLPSAIGIPAGMLWERYYRRKLGDSLANAAPVS